MLANCLKVSHCFHSTVMAHVCSSRSIRAFTGKPRAIAPAVHANKRGARFNAFARPAVSQSTNGVVTLPPLPPLDENYEKVCEFASYANWVVPGHVLVGRYPYVEPSRCATHSQGEAQIKEILEAGLNTFVSLQAEVPPQSEMKLKGVGGFMPYKAVVELEAAALNPPAPMEIISGLRNPHLDAYLPPRKKQSKAAADFKPLQLQLHFHHCPIVDLSVPTNEQLAQVLTQLYQSLAAGERVYLHCWGGRGRAGTVAACLLASFYNLSADEALERVQRSFDTRRDSERRSPETDEQHELVRSFVRSGWKPS